MLPLSTCDQNVAVLPFDEGICAHSNEVFRELATLGKLASLLLVWNFYCVLPRMNY